MALPVHAHHVQLGHVHGTKPPDELDVLVADAARGAHERPNHHVVVVGGDAVAPHARPHEQHRHQEGHEEREYDRGVNVKHVHVAQPREEQADRPHENHSQNEGNGHAAVSDPVNRIVQPYRR